MLREQKTAKAGCSREGRLEVESSGRARSVASPKTGVGDHAEGLLERILWRENMNAAYLRVKGNRGAAGVDGMRVEEMLAYLRAHGQELVEEIRKGTYRPKPVRRVEIPKPDGGKRQLGVPTVIDRMVQQAVAQVLEPILDETFSEHSYGFRIGRSAHDAIREAEGYYKEGYTQVVDIDLAKYFDTVNHGQLLKMLREDINDERVIDLIRKFLRSGVMVGGLYQETREGTPQGGNLSPLLSNVYLRSFDRELEARGHKFVRYADDCNIYVKSRRAAERVMRSCTSYLEGRLKLTVNREKSKVGSPLRLKFLGFSLYKVGKQAGIRPHGKSIKRFKAKVRELTMRNQAKPIAIILKQLKLYTRGWLGYYALADMKSQMASMNEWLRRRIRQIHWKQWKKPKARYENLKRLGIPADQARQWSYSRLGYWRVAGSWILSRSLTNERLASMGYDDISQRYEAMHAGY
jgi:group II intron reverse transcriptase/maturase